jgi:hypothetical protein
MRIVSKALEGFFNQVLTANAANPVFSGGSVVKQTANLKNCGIFSRGSLTSVHMEIFGEEV